MVNDLQKVLVEK